MCGGELLFEYLPEFFPVQEFWVAKIFRELFPSKYASCPFGGSSGLHVGHGPHYLGLIITEFFGAEADVRLAGVEEGQTLLAISVKLRRGGGLWSPSLLGCVLRVGCDVLRDEGRCRRGEGGILSQLSHGVEYLIQFAPHPSDRLFEVGHSFVFVHLYGAKGVDGQ